MRFDRQIATAQRQIAKNGLAVVWRQPIRGVIQDKPWIQQNNVPIDYDVVICFIPLKRIGKETTTPQFPDIESGSEQGLMGAVPFEPAYEDVVIRGDETLRIANISKLAPNGQPILYTIEFAL